MKGGSAKCLMTVKLVLQGHDLKLHSGEGPTLREAARGFMISLRASASHAPGSLGALENTLAMISHYAEANDWPACLDITTEHIEEYLVFFRTRRLRNSLKATRTPSSAYLEGQYRRLKQFFGWQIKRGHRDDNPLDVIPRPIVDQKIVATVTEREMQALMYAVDPRQATSPTDRFRRLRDQAILLMFWDTPGRRSELANLALGDVDLGAGGVTVMGKGRRQRWMPIGARVVEALWEYLQARESRSPSTDRLWIQSEGKPMTDSNWVYLMLKRRCKEAGIPPLHIHQYRHAYIMAALRNKTPDQTIKAATGHRKYIPETYYRTLGEEDLAAAHREFSPADRLGQQNDKGWSPKQKRNARGRL